MKKYLKKVVESDCKILFQWSNEKLVRGNSFSSKAITFEEHMEWFKKRLGSNSCYLYIFCIDENPVGQVRLDVENEIGTISYSLDKDYRGQGLAIEMLELLENQIYESNMKVKILKGYVKSGNLASQKVFQRLQYDNKTENNNFRFLKYL
ncbi:MAG TPA: GNAT family N-acetyltransferase [Clostridium sp.]|uniref:GNAT family N-acetyltransferase n=1 Tax=Clostridium sp. TaxID=1506 RepID=UPI002F929535